IIKRDGSRVSFNIDKIAVAVEKAMRASGEFKDGVPFQIAESVVAILDKNKTADLSFVPSVEEVQDEVERELMAQEFLVTAKAYIVYREQHAQMRKRDIFKKRINLKPYEYPELL